MSQRQLPLTQTCLNAKKKFDGRAYGFPAAGSGLFVQHPMIHYVSRVSHQSSHCLTKLCWPNNITGLGNTEQEVMFFVNCGDVSKGCCAQLTMMGRKLYPSCTVNIFLWYKPRTPYCYQYVYALKACCISNIFLMFDQPSWNAVKVHHKSWQSRQQTFFLVVVYYRKSIRKAK